MSTKNRLGVVGLGAAACVACCAGPILVFLGGLSVAGIASATLVGGAGLVFAAVAAAAFLVVRRRGQRSACATAPAGPVPVKLLTRTDGALGPRT